MRKSLGYIFLLLVLVGFVYASFNVNLESPVDNSFLNYNNINFTFNVTGNYSYYNCSIYTNQTTTWMINQTNVSVWNDTSTTFALNNLVDGGYIWNIYCINATEENWSIANYSFTVDTIYPNWSINVTYPDSGNPYNTTIQYYFNVSWTDANLDDVWIEHNFNGTLLNYTNVPNISNVYFYNISDIASETYQWKMFANDSSGNINSTYAFTYIVTKAAPSLNLTLNGTQGNRSINMGDSVNITGSVILGEGSEYIELRQDGVLINNGSSPLSNITVFNTPGNYNITLVYNQTQNYSFGYETLWVTVNDTSAPNITFISPQNNSIITLTYVDLNLTTDILSKCQYLIDVGSYNNITTSYSLLHNITLTSLSEALHNITVNCTNQFGNNTVEDISFTVDSIYPGWSTNISYPTSPVNYTVSQDYQFNVTWIDTNLDSVWIQHNFNGTLINYSTVPNVGNVYFYNYSTLAAYTSYQWRMYANDTVGNVNYTSTFVYTVNRALSNVTLLLNGTSDNFSIDEGDYVNITSKLITGEANILVYKNGNLINNGTSSLENITSFSTSGTYNITVLYPQSQNYTSDHETWWITVNDTSAPVITFISPQNTSFTNESTVLLNVTTDDLSTCQFIQDGGSYINITTSYTTIHNITRTSLSDAVHNVTVNCTNQFSLNTVEQINFTVDTTISQITINYPNNVTVNTQTIELNYTLDEQNPDKVWYTKNYNTTKFTLTYTNSSGINLENITLSRAGWNVLTLYVNDTSSNIASDTVSFYLNLSVNISDFATQLNSSLNINSVTPFNSTGDIISNNISTDDSVSLELNFTDKSVDIFNFSGTYANWEYLFEVTDNDATFVSEVQSQAGKNPVDYVYFKNFTRFFNRSNDYYGKVMLPNNESAYTGIFYCDSDDASSCLEISPCSGSFTESTGTACYNNTVNNVFVYVPHFSAVFGDNDTLLPVINITSPANNSVVGQSYQIPLIFTVNEYSTCGYVKNNDATLLSPTAGTSFTKYIDHYVNEQLNITVNCTDTEGNTASLKINITINDVTAPVISETVTVTNDDVDIDFTINEPTNHSIAIDGDTTSADDETQTSASWSTSHSESFNNIGDDDYDYTIKACDRLNNCDTDTGTFTVDTSTGGGDTGGGGGGGGGGTGSTATTVSQVWQTPSKGQYLMNIPSTSIAFTEIDFTLKNDLTKNLLISVQTRDLPSYVPVLQDNKVFQYIKIDKYPITDDDLSKVEIRVRVDRSWLTTNNIDTDTVSLWRYTNKWIKLSTKKKSTDSSYTYYEVTSPGLSYFAIAGIELAVTPDTGLAEQNTSTGSTPTGETVEEVTTTEDQTQPDTTDKKKKISGFIWIPLIILILIIGAGAGFIYYQRNISVQTDDELKGLREYVERCKGEGIEFKHIRDTLVKAGWSESIIDLVVHDIKIPKKDMDQVLNYINVLKGKNRSDEDIKTNLRKAGWQEDVIEQAMKKSK